MRRRIAVDVARGSQSNPLATYPCHSHNTGDPRDYENAIPEEDETGGNVDPCYAQLLYNA
jgi:hypothetical protein